MCVTDSRNVEVSAFKQPTNRNALDFHVNSGIGFSSVIDSHHIMNFLFLQMVGESCAAEILHKGIFQGLWFSVYLPQKSHIIKY